METLTIEVDIDDLHKEFCRQGITEGEGEDPAYFYLAALALECRDDEDYDLHDTLMEFIRHELDTSEDAADRIEDLLR